MAARTVFTSPLRLMDGLGGTKEGLRGKDERKTYTTCDYSVPSTGLLIGAADFKKHGSLIQQLVKALVEIFAGLKVRR